MFLMPPTHAGNNVERVAVLREDDRGFANAPQKADKRVQFSFVPLRSTGADQQHLQHCALLFGPIERRDGGDERLV